VGSRDDEEKEGSILAGLPRGLLGPDGKGDVLSVLPKPVLFRLSVTTSGGWRWSILEEKTVD
jgi:hypothetical protein